MTCGRALLRILLKSEFGTRVALPSLAGFGGVVFLVLTALWTIVDQTNRQDEQRTHEVATGALHAFQAELAKNLADNALWDDAADYIYNKPDPDWFMATWGVATDGSAYYDTVHILDDTGNVLAAFRHLQPITDTPGQVFGSEADMLISRARAAGVGSETMFSGFMSGKFGVAAVAAATVSPLSDAVNVPKDKPRVLVLARHLTEPEITRLGERFFIRNLRTATASDAPDRITLVNDPSGKVVGRLTWDANLPGTMSYERVQPQIIAAVLLISAIAFLLVALSARLTADLSRREAKASFDATHDPLTGLLNRAGLKAELAKRFAPGARNEPVALAYVDLDGFKEVNDTYGHSVGDALLSAFANMLRRSAGDAVLARLGGDEFACLITGADAAARSEAVATAILEAVQSPFGIGERLILVGGSIGIANAHPADLSADEIVRRADVAMYWAKENGRGRCFVYQASMDGERAERNAIEADLRAAIESEQIDVHYQPLISADRSTVTGVEALVRWRHPVRGMLAPDKFIGIAESSGLIDRLGLYVLRRTCLDGAAWPGLKLSVNISPVQFRDPHFPAHVARILSETGTSASRVTLEVTETVLITNPERAEAVFAALHAIGIKVALDDFGSGFSSIGYLRRFKFDRVKIDRSLITALDQDANGTVVLHSTAALAASLGLGVTAEGIERDEQAAIVRLAGCDELQGYLFSRPVPAEQIHSFIVGRMNGVEASAAA